MYKLIQCLDNSVETRNVIILVRVEHLGRCPHQSIKEGKR